MNVQALRRWRWFVAAVALTMIALDLVQQWRQVEFMNQRRAQVDQIQNDTIQARDRMEAMLRELVNRQ